MVHIIPTGAVLGAVVYGLDISQPLSERNFGVVLGALGRYGVLCFPTQKLDAAALKAFGGRFGELEINVVSAPFQDEAHPEVMILSNMMENGRPIGLADAGQDWHTDMSYSSTIAFANVLPQIALEHLRWACAAGLPRAVVLLDAGYGNSSALRADMTALDLTYVAGIQSKGAPARCHGFARISQSSGTK